MLVSPCPGKCLPQAAMPSACSVRMIADAEPGDVLRAFGQRAIADDRVLRIGVDVEHRRVVERDADGLQLRRERRANRSASVSSPLRAERGHRRPLGERRLQPRDAAAFLVDADPQRQLAREHCDSRDIRHLLGLVDVAREEDDAAEVELPRERRTSSGISCPLNPTMAAGRPDAGCHGLTFRKSYCMASV